MSLQFRVGDVFDRLAEIDDATIDLIVTSPPFLALRSYLPADHPDKGKEIGSEPTPAAFLDVVLALTAEWGRVLAPHGSICVELGDTYASSGGTTDNRAASLGGNDLAPRGRRGSGHGWPRAKSRTMLDTLYPACLAYGRNLLDPDAVPFDPWLIRNMITWARPNPPVGALGDKWRPACSHITVATRSPRRYHDLDAVRTPSDWKGAEYQPDTHHQPDNTPAKRGGRIDGNPAGAPPLDWHADVDHDILGGDMLWKLPPGGYNGPHYAVFPSELPRRMIEAMCPRRVCTTCGEPSRRITERTPEYAAHRAKQGAFRSSGDRGWWLRSNRSDGDPELNACAQHVTVGWTDCEHNTWRTGLVLDPFAGSGTTLAAATDIGRDAIGIDVDERNADLARERCGMFLEVTA